MPSSLPRLGPLLLALLATTLLSCGSPPVSPKNPATASAASTAPPAPPQPAPYIIGADISWVQQAEARGLQYSDNGTQKDILQILKDHGFNYIRLRLFVDPKAPGGYAARFPEAFCDLPHTIAMAKRVKGAGMGFLLDFHYSDNWADPGKQTKPLAWRDLPFDALVQKVHDYTKDALLQFQAAGASPDMVQIGNEITPGMLLNQTAAGRNGNPPAETISTQPTGSTHDWTKLAALLNAGISATREVDPRALVMLHIDRGGNNPATVRWVDAALAHGVKFDVLGLSCYSTYQGPPSGWQANFADLVTRYPHLSFVMAEYSQDKRAANDIMRTLPDHRGLGTFIWEPTQYAEAVFDRQGHTLPGILVYDQMSRDYAHP